MNNRLLPYTWLHSHHLCQADCAASAAQGERLLAAITQAADEGGRLLRERLRKPVLFLENGRSLALDGRWHGDAFLLNGDVGQGALPLAWQLQGVRALELDPHGITLRLHAGSKRLDSSRPLLIEPGEALHPLAAAAIAEAAPRRASPAAVPGGRQVGVDDTGRPQSGKSRSGQRGSDAAVSFDVASVLRHELPIALGMDWSVTAVHKTPRGPQELHLRHTEGGELFVQVRPSEPGRPSYAEVAGLAVSYRSAPGESPPLVVAAMDGLVRYLHQG